MRTGIRGQGSGTTVASAGARFVMADSSSPIPDSVFFSADSRFLIPDSHFLIADSRSRIALRRRLLSWFERNARALPWRRNRDPYHIWVSEIMLQQTQVATVIPYFERFIQRFPTATHLAAATEQDVLHLWQGLGYYRRARDLHTAARRLAREHDGVVPDDATFLRSLPGMGRYTVGAVLSQAFDRRLPILEANSLRVLTRLLGVRADPRRRPANGWLWQAAERLLPRRRSGDFNQALMELGALVCTPQAPRCESCPLARSCVARNLGVQNEIPRRPDPPAVEETREAAVIVWRGDKVLLAQRPADGRWASMWEFPHRVLAVGESHEGAAARLLQDWTGLRATLGSERQTIRHGVTRFRITMVCFDARYQGGRFSSPFYADGRWVTPATLPRYPVSAPQRRLMQALVEPHGQARLF
jgi:A/G-specific adenine glycosylase